MPSTKPPTRRPGRRSRSPSRRRPRARRRLYTVVVVVVVPRRYTPRAGAGRALSLGLQLEAHLRRDPLGAVVGVEAHAGGFCPQDQFVLRLAVRGDLPQRLLEHDLVVERASVGRPPCKPLAGAPEYIAPTHPRPRHFCEGQRGAEPVPGPERPPELHVQRRQRERRAGAGDEVSVHPTSREELVPAVLEVRGVHGVVHDVVLFLVSPRPVPAQRSHVLTWSSS